MAFFLISSKVLGLFNQLIGLLGLLAGLSLIYPRLSTEFGMLVFCTNLGLLEFMVRYMTLFLLFSVIGGFK